MNFARLSRIFEVPSFQFEYLCLKTRKCEPLLTSKAGRKDEVTLPALQPVQYLCKILCKCSNDLIST